MHKLYKDLPFGAGEFFKLCRKLIFYIILDYISISPAVAFRLDLVEPAVQLNQPFRGQLGIRVNLQSLTTQNKVFSSLKIIIKL